jgi:hypothetical protein
MPRVAVPRYVALAHGDGEVEARRRTRRSGTRWLQAPFERQPDGGPGVGFPVAAVQSLAHARQVRDGCRTRCRRTGTCGSVDPSSNRALLEALGDDA